jgi:hypothetical protein
MKIIIKYLVLSFFVLVSISSCDTSIPVILDGEERYSAEGRVVDENGRPIPDLWVCIQACKNTSSCTLSGVAKTDHNGYFNMVHSGDDGQFYTLYINDPIIGNDGKDIRFAYHNRSYKYPQNDYNQYHKNFGDVGFLKKGTRLTVFCSRKEGDKACQAAVYSHQMDIISSDLNNYDRTYKLYSIPAGKSLAINVPLNDTVFVEYKKWQRTNPFFPVYTWYTQTLFMEGQPQRVSVR